MEAERRVKVEGGRAPALDEFDDRAVSIPAAWGFKYRKHLRIGFDKFIKYTHKLFKRKCIPERIEGRWPKFFGDLFESEVGQRGVLDGTKEIDKNGIRIVSARKIITWFIFWPVLGLRPAKIKKIEENFREKSNANLLKGIANGFQGLVRRVLETDISYPLLGPYVKVKGYECQGLIDILSKVKGSGTVRIIMSPENGENSVAEIGKRESQRALDIAKNISKSKNSRLIENILSKEPAKDKIDQISKELEVPPIYYSSFLEAKIERGISYHPIITALRHVRLHALTFTALHFLRLVFPDRVELYVHKGLPSARCNIVRSPSTEEIQQVYFVRLYKWAIGLDSTFYEIKERGLEDYGQKLYEEATGEAMERVGDVANLLDEASETELRQLDIDRKVREADEFLRESTKLEIHVKGLDRLTVLRKAEEGYIGALKRLIDYYSKPLRDLYSRNKKSGIIALRGLVENIVKEQGYIDKSLMWQLRKRVEPDYIKYKEEEEG